ncbi:MAG: class I SAM-dependent methyltransferase [Betaproteobacteria bacterium]|nr:class I SAM-dependent methyltransferase [Betaproteobacteria bacterium]MDH3435824.1 class I SAM-dependent methyltransferase [Betaproteobacteria bacterium]
MPHSSAPSAPLITEEYREMQRKLHENPEYGTASVAYAPIVAEVISRLQTAELLDTTELLDYGAGKGRLGEALREHIKTPLKIHQYDPAVPLWSKPPEPCSLVACIDVLEHIEPNLLDNVLDDLKRVTLQYGVFTVHTQAAKKVLLDGRNAHLIQQQPRWWLPKFTERFELVVFNRLPEGFWVLVERTPS